MFHGWQSMHSDDSYHHTTKSFYSQRPPSDFWIDSTISQRFLGPILHFVSLRKDNRKQAWAVHRVEGMLRDTLTLNSRNRKKESGGGEGREGEEDGWAQGEGRRGRVKERGGGKDKERREDKEDTGEGKEQKEDGEEGKGKDGEEVEEEEHQEEGEEEQHQEEGYFFNPLLG